MTLGDEKYIALTTYRRNGDAVTTPVWIAPIGGNAVGFWTSSGSGKAKRLAHTTRVQIQPSDSRGRPKAGTSPVEANAKLVSNPDPQFVEIQSAIKAKYGFMTKITKLLGTIGGLVKRNRIPYGDRGVVITLP